MPASKGTAKKREAGEASTESTGTVLSSQVPEALPVRLLEPQAFRHALGQWYRKHARELPWRGIHDPYATWLSEIMLQQTRVATVIDRYAQFLRQFPTIGDLANTQEADVLALWSGLGYYRRARMLHRGAQFVQMELGGHLPSTAAELRRLPGIGEYTSAAIASIAFGERVAAVDGNVERVLLRVLGLPEDRTARAKAELLRVAQQLVPPAAEPENSYSPADHTQAMMELGATVCLPRGPLCLQCPVVAFCRTRGEHRTEARSKPQSRTVAHLLLLRKRKTSTQVLLERRPAEASLMPGMLELPPLPLDAVEGREPALRLRHSITNTNYNVEVYGESSAMRRSSRRNVRRADAPPQLLSVLQQELLPAAEESSGDEEPALSLDAKLLRDAVVAAKANLKWYSLAKLHRLPLTGLARKSLQRLHLMAVSEAQLP